MITQDNSKAADHQMSSCCLCMDTNTKMTTAKYSTGITSYKKAETSGGSKSRLSGNSGRINNVLISSSIEKINCVEIISNEHYYINLL